MNNRILLIIYFIIWGVFILKAPAQNVNPELQTFDVTLNHSETIKIYSDEVKDTFYVFVKLPKGYTTNTGQNYPAIFLLDGDIAFPMSWSVVRYLQYGNYIPDVLIFGIGYGGLFTSNTLNNRERDYSISNIPQLKTSGGGERFLNFIKKELLPLLKSTYRIDNSNLTLSGHSLGGLFVLYALFNEPDLFSNYIASSPFIQLNYDALIKTLEQKKEKINSSLKRLFISVGEDEENLEYLEPINKFVNKLYECGLTKEKIELRVFENGAHYTTPSEALTYGLIFSFSK